MIHKTAEVSKDSTLGKNCFVWHGTQVREGVTIGNNCILAKGVYIDRNCQIGNNVKIQNYASIYEMAIIEDGVFVGPYVCFSNDKYPRAITTDGTIKSESDWEKGVTTVRSGSSIGAGTVILPGITIGNFAMIGAGSVVVRDVMPHTLVFGNPAVFRGYVCACGRIITKSKIKPKDFICLQCKTEKKSK